MVDNNNSKKVKIIMVLLDGLADHTHLNAETGKHESPMQKAKTPVMDALCNQGFFGVHDPV